MGFIIVLLFVSVPVLEIAIFIEAGEKFGLWPTIGAILGTAIIGMACLRVQGPGVLKRIRDSLARNEKPLRELWEGLCLMMAGALLLTPGFFTDTIGFCLLFPPFRRAAGALVAARVAQRSNGFSFSTRAPHTNGGRKKHGGRGPVIDGDFEDVTEAENRGSEENNPRRIDPPD